jgi:EmrB/QacA subfamily drug resistance transporter
VLPHPRHHLDLAGRFRRGLAAVDRGPSHEDANLNTVLAACALAMFATNLDFFALNLAIPGMARDLEVSTTDMQWAISGYLLALGAFLIPGGRLGDLLGRRRMLIFGTALFGVTSLVGGLAPSAGFLIGARLFQGVGAAILFPLAIAVITNTFPEERRKRAIGNLYGLAAAATAVGPFVGGGLTELLSWRWVLLVNVPVAIIGVALMLRSVPESRDETVPRSIDWDGLAAVTFAVDRGEDWGWGSAQTIGLFCAGALLLIAFVAIERRATWPLIDLSLFRNRPYVAITLLGMTANIVFVVTTFAATLYLQDVRGYSPIEGGFIFLAASLMQAVAGPLSGRLAERFDVPKVMAVSIAIGAVGLLTVAAGVGIGLYACALVVFGIGYGVCWAILSVGTQSVVPTEQAGAASGVSLAIVIGMAGLCVAIAAALIETLTGPTRSEGESIELILRALAIGSVPIAIVLAAIGARRAPRAASDC